eukprot:2303125-Rhodomonas_salina.3
MAALQVFSRYMLHAKQTAPRTRCPFVIVLLPSGDIPALFRCTGCAHEKPPIAILVNSALLLSEPSLSSQTWAKIESEATRGVRAGQRHEEAERAAGRVQRQAAAREAHVPARAGRKGGDEGRRAQKAVENHPDGGAGR